MVISVLYKNQKSCNVGDWRKSNQLPIFTNLCFFFNSKRKYVKTLVSTVPEKASAVGLPEASITTSTLRGRSWFSQWCSHRKKKDCVRDAELECYNVLILPLFIFFFNFFCFTKNYLLNLIQDQIFSSSLRLYIFVRKIDPLKYFHPALKISVPNTAERGPKICSVSKPLHWPTENVKILSKIVSLFPYI